MAKNTPDAIIDLALAVFEGTNVSVTSAQPANFAGIAAVTLATQAIVGSYTKSAGVPDGRRNAFPEQVDVPITGAGTQDATHIVVDDGAAIRIITTCTTQPLTNGGTVTIPEWFHTIRQLV